jgi:hypothetical protein
MGKEKGIMKILSLLLTVGLLYCGAANASWAAQKDCSQHDTSPMKQSVCDVLETENQMLGNAAEMIEAECSGKSSKSCENAKRRITDLQTEIVRGHEENDALEEADYTEMIAASYKGKDKERDDGGKSCQAKFVDFEARDEFLLDMNVQESASCNDCLVYFSSNDSLKANDNICNNWKVKVIDENGEKSGIINVSERQEGLCPTECKGKEKLVEEKKVRFQNRLDNSISEMTIAATEMANETERLGTMSSVASSVQAMATSDCDAMETEAPISNGVIIAAFTVLHVTEAAVEFCEPPAQQTAFGFNAASACLVLKVAWLPALEIYDVLSNFNDEFQGEQITHTQKCVELLNTKIDTMGGQIDEINKTVLELRELILTPSGRRISGDTGWPNK